jgi:hypothetical protein
MIDADRHEDMSLRWRARLLAMAAEDRLSLLATMLGFAHRLAALCDPRLALPMFLQSLAFQLSRFRAYAGARRKNMAYE